MEEKKIKVSKELRKSFEIRCNENPIYSLLLFRITGIEKNKLSLCSIELSIKDICFLYVLLDIDEFERLKEEKYLYIKRAIDMFKGHASYSEFEETVLGYVSPGTLEKTMYRKNFSKPIVEDLIEKGVLDKDYEKRMKIEKIQNRANDIMIWDIKEFNQSEAFQNYKEQFKVMLKGLDLSELEIIYANIDIYWYIDIYDWRLIGLWQRFKYKQKEDFIRFIESQSLCFSLNEIHIWKYIECKKREKPLVLESKDKNTLVKEIMQKVNKIIDTNKNQYNNYTTMGFLIKHLKYLCYLTKDDWKLLSYLAMLEKKENRKETNRRKEWCIKFVKGIILENFSTVL